MYHKAFLLFTAQAASMAIQQSQPIFDPDTLSIGPPGSDNQRRSPQTLDRETLVIEAPTSGNQKRSPQNLDSDTLVITPPNSNRKRQDTLDTESLSESGIDARAETPGSGEEEEEGNKLEPRSQPVFDPDTLIIQNPDNSNNKRRAVCNADNPLRNLRDSRFAVYASEFCSQFIRPTLTKTVYTVVTTRATTTVPPALVTVTNFNVVSKTVTNGVVTVTITPSLPTPTQNQNQKRDDSVVYPAWLSEYYPFSRVSSACSCFISSPSPTLIRTVTAATTSLVVDVKRLPTSSITITKTSTSVVNVAPTQTVVGDACAISGCSNGDDLIETSDDFATLSDCKAHCLSVSNCLGYQFSTTSDHNNCNIASVGAINLYSNYSSMFPQCQQQSKLYDRNCNV